MLCVEESQVFSSTIEVLLLAPALYLSQTYFRKREGSGEMRIQAVSHCTVQCGTITLQYFVK